jgi:ABC-type nitrate/sulfonate/bicarbonate transport system substrate-binding protein
MNFPKVKVVVVWVFVLAIVLTACGAPSSNGSGPGDQVTVQLSWFPSVEYAGFYAALEQGFYAEAGLDVTLKSGGPEVDALGEVKSGNSQFGVGTGDSLIIARSNGDNFVAVSTIFRNNPMVAMSLSSADIQKPEDLAGKNIGVIAPDLSTTWDVQFLALLQEMNVQQDSISFSAIEDYHGANELKSGRLDVMSGMFATNEPVVAKLAGDALNLIFYKDYGIDVYPNAIFVTDEFVQDNPDLVGRFVKATLRGYQFAIEYPEAVAAFALKYDDALDLTVQQETMKAQIPFIDTGDAPIGSMDEAVWNTTQEILLQFGLIAQPIDLATVYTNQFIAP